MNRYVMFSERTGDPAADNENREINRMLSGWAVSESRKRCAPSGRRGKKQFYLHAEALWLYNFKLHLVDVARRILKEGHR